MFTKSLILTTAILLFPVCQLQADIIHSTWVGGAGGSWYDENNWSPPIVPNNTVWDRFEVSIDSYGYKAAIGIGDSPPISIDKLECRGYITLYGPWYPVKLTLEKEGLINYGELDALRLDITGILTNKGDAELNIDDFFSAHGDLYNELNAEINVEYRYMEIADANIVNNGLIRASANGALEAEIDFDNSNRIELYSGGVSGGTFNNNDTGVVEGFGYVDSEQLTMNNGTIYALGGALVMRSSGSIMNTGILGNKPLATLNLWSFSEVNNFRTIEVNAGGGVALYFNLVNEPNAVITLLNGTLAAKTITQKAGAILKGFGGITGDIVIEPNAVVELTGPTNIVGNMTIGEGAILDISNGTVLVTGDVTCNNGIIQTTNGTFIVLGKQFGICQRKIIDVLSP
ncbi:MAG: hypothetical protein JXA81_04965 [Sedimentisphaerales bacterium]|nr:hypothetical protein [Sedimentisphaerales bacterium]